MNPELDERLIYTVSSSFVEIIIDWLKITAFREGYGETFNEGLCYEFCAGIPFSGKVNGEFFIGMDGFTKILILPYIIRSIDMKTPHKELVQTAMNSFINKIAEEFSIELKEILEVKIEEIRSLNHKIVPLPQEIFRKYTVIYFLRDDDEKKYLGRIYLHLAVNKD